MNFKAIHNKDDSVVKTFRVGQLTLLFLFPLHSSTAQKRRALLHALLKRKLEYRYLPT